MSLLRRLFRWLWLDLFTSDQAADSEGNEINDPPDQAAEGGKRADRPG